MPDPVHEPWGEDGGPWAGGEVTAAGEYAHPAVTRADSLAWPLPGGTESVRVVFCRSCGHAWWQADAPLPELDHGPGPVETTCTCEAGNWVTGPRPADLPTAALEELGIAPVSAPVGVSSPGPGRRRGLARVWFAVTRPGRGGQEERD